MDVEESGCATYARKGKVKLWKEAGERYRCFEGQPSEGSQSRIGGDACGVKQEEQRKQKYRKIKR